MALILAIGLFSIHLLPILAQPTLMSLAPAGYPRAITLANGSGVATCEKSDPVSGAPRIVLLSSIHPGQLWDVTATVVEDSSGINPDLANGFLLETVGGDLLVAYRHHTGPELARIYRIAISRSTNGGLTWEALSVVWQGSVGVWEPFLYAVPGGIRVAYSAEITNGGEQDIVQQESLDGGITWGPRMLIVHTPGSRNGMPGIAVLPDSSLIAVFEGFWTGVWGAFTVNCVRSFDGGVTWGQGEIVFAPPRNSGFNAGSPQASDSLCSIFRNRRVFLVQQGSVDLQVSIGITGRINIVFMTSVPEPYVATTLIPISRIAPTVSAWPNNASIALIGAYLDISNSSAPLNFTGVALSYVPLTTPTGYWPSFLSSGSSLSVVYQDALDNAAETGI